MRFLFLILLTSPALAQTNTLPEAVSDEPTQNDLNFLFQKDIALTQEINTLFVSTNSGASLLPFWQQSGNSIYNTNLGNVGINTNSPATRLDVLGPIRAVSTPFINPTSGKGLEIYYDATNNNGAIQPFDRTNTTYQTLLVGGAPLEILSAGTTVSTFSAAGQILNNTSELYFQGNTALGGNSTNLPDIEIFHAAEGRMAMGSLQKNQITAWDLYGTTSTIPVNEGIAELTVHGCSKLSCTGTSFIQDSYGILDPSIGGDIYDSMESSGTFQLRNRTFRHESSAFESWDGTHYVPGGSEIYLNFQSTPTIIGPLQYSWPIEFQRSHIQFNTNDFQIGANSDYYIGRQSGLVFNIPSNQQDSFLVNGSTEVAIDGSANLLRVMSAAAGNPSTGKSIEIGYNSTSDSAFIDSNDRTGGLTRKPTLVQGTPLTLANNGSSIEFIYSTSVVHASGIPLVLSGSGGFITNGSSVTASAFFGDGSHLTGVVGGSGSTNTLPKFTASSTLGNSSISDNGSSITESETATFTSTVTVQGNAFSVGASTLVVASGQIGILTSSPATSLDVNGNAQFGSGVNRSTFTTTGNLQLVAGSTITSNGTLSISTAASAATTSLPAIFINPSNYVGIGTKTPLTSLVSVSSDSTTSWWAAYTQAGLILKNPSGTNNDWNQILFSDSADGLIGSVGVQETSHSGPNGEMSFGIANGSINQVLFLTTVGHVELKGSAPSISSCGTVPNGSVVGNDLVGVISVGGGVVTSCTMTFNSNTWTNAPVCVISDNSTAITGDISSVSTSQVVFSFSASLGGGKIYYHCFGYR